MLTNFNAAKQREEGFTLIELLIVVIVIGILAAIALPIFIDQQKVAIDASVQSDVRNSVTNVTNAQAQDSGIAKAAVSNANTSVALTAVPRGSAAGAAATTDVATRADSELGNVPALGSAYVLAGYNVGGKKYQGPTVANGKAFTFTAATGQFSATDASGAEADGGSGGNPSGGSPSNSFASATTPGVANDSGYSGTASQFSFNNYSGEGNNNVVGYITSAGAVQLQGGWYSSETNTFTNSPAFLNGAKASDGQFSVDLGTSPVSLHEANGKVISGWSESECYFDVYPYDRGDATSSGNLNKYSVNAQFSCGPSNDVNATAADAAALKGGYLEYTYNNVTERINITGTVEYRN